MKAAATLEPQDEVRRPAPPLFKVLAESLETVATQACGLLIGIPMLAITAHWLGPQGRGVFVTTTTWAGLAATCCGFSLGLVAIHEMGRLNDPDIGALLGTLFVFAAAETFLAWCLLFIAHRIAPQLFGDIQGLALILGIGSIPFLILKDYFGALLIAQNRIVVWNRAQLAGTALSFVLAVLLAAGALVTVDLIVMAWLCGQILVCGISFNDVRRRATSWSFRKHLARSLFSGGCKLHINAIGSIAISSIDVLMVNSFVGAREVGYYQLALKLATNIAVIAQAVGTVTYGRVVALGPDGSWALIRRICGLTMGLMIAVALVAAWFAPWIVRIVAGTTFAPSVPLFRLMLLAVPGLSIGYLMTPQWICRGYFWQAGGLTLLVAGANALGNWILVPRYGALGAAISFIIVYIVSILVNGAMFGFCEWRWRHADARPVLPRRTASSAR
ncbi:MAG: lipopolysaccharide biosynthesis protein [Candidatus Binataceae bacterium]